MKLLNHTLKYVSIALVIIIGIWALIFYLKMVDEVEDSIDDGLENTKLIVISRIEKDAGIIQRSGFSEHNYRVLPIRESEALKFKDLYQDTLMYTLNEKDLEPFRMLTTVFGSQGNFYQLKVVSSAVEQDDIIRNLLYGMIALYLAVLVSIMVVNNVVLQKIWKPFYQLLSRLKDFKIEQQQAISLPETNVKEFNELNHAIAALTAQSVETYASERTFTENASHELQTPLAVALGKLESLTDHHDLNGPDAATIGEVIAELQRISRINKSLLLLNKIEGRQYISKESVNINEIILRLMADFEDYAALKSINVEVIEQAQLIVVLNAELANIIITNLFKNALTHHSGGAKLKVLIASNQLMFSNLSNNSALDEKQLFKRFTKGTGGKNSSGLGLAIAQSAAKASGLIIQYRFNGEHCFLIKF